MNPCLQAIAKEELTIKANRLTARAASVVLAGILAVGPVAAGAADPAAAAGGSGKAGSASAPQASGHWAEASLDRWLKAGIIQGYPDGTLKPERAVARAEFAAVVNRLFGLTRESAAPIPDAPSAWAAREMSRAFAAGYLSPTSAGAAEPGRPMTRAEVALALSKLFLLEPPAEGSGKEWPDLGGLDEATVRAIRGLTANGYVNGLPDGTFRPNGTVTRGELASLTDRMVALLVRTAGETKPGSVNGHAIVNAAGASLSEADIAGNLYLAPGIGEGGAKLDRTTVRGTVFALGGGEPGIEFKDAKLSGVVVDRPGGAVRLKASGGTTIGAVRFVTGGSLTADEAASSGIEAVEASSGAGEVRLQGDYRRVTTLKDGSRQATLIVAGHISELVVNGPASIRLENGASIDKATVAADAGNTVLEGTGTVGQVDDRSGTLVNRLAAGGSAGGSSPSSPSRSDWRLVWSDEFEKAAIDRTKWTFDTTNGESVGNPGWGNNELEYYTDRPENAKTEDGKLVITARKEEYGGMPYTSARLKTKGLFSQTYGKFEIRAKAPTGKGFWPAIWMLPENDAYGGWAASGEIDIMEGWGSKPGTVAGTIHYGGSWPGNVYSGNSYDLPNGGTIADFHTYTLEWEPNEMRWYVDGHLFSTKNDWYSRGAGQHDNYSYPAPFDQPFHLLMNLAVGGNFDGNPTEETKFPARMEVDYVRVYAKDPGKYKPPVPPVYPKEEYPPGSKLPQGPDRDLVYNSGFTQNVEGDPGMGTPGTAHWALYQDPGASGAVTIEDIGGTNYARVDIASAGGNSYSIQPQAIVSLAKGRYYKLTFEAKTDTSRNMTVRLTGGQSRGFAAYSQSLDAALTSDFNTYEMKFQMKENSDAAARIEFNMGTNAHPVWLGKAKLVEIDSIPFEHDSPKQPQEDGNHVYNGSFDQGEPNRMSYWHLAVSGGASATASVPSQPASERKLNVAVARGGVSASDVKLVQKGLYLLEGQDYELAFDAKASRARTIEVGLYRKDGTPIAARSVSLTDSTTTVKAAFSGLPAPSDDEGQLVFSLGGEAGSVQIDNVKLLRTSVHFDPDTVFYPLRNGDFGEGLAYWETSGNGDQAGAAGPGAIRAEAADGAAKATIDAQGGKPWNALLFQSGIPVKANVAYELSFDARSTADRPMEVVVENGSPRHLDQVVELSGETKTYSFEFKPTKSETVGLKFLLGLIRPADPKLPSHDVYIGNVRLAVKNAPVAQPPSLRKDTTDNYAGQDIEIAFRDDEAWRSKAAKVAVDGTALDAGDYELAPGVLKLRGERFAAAGAYTVTVSAAGYADASVVQTILAGDGNLVVNGDFSRGTANWASWSGEGGAAEWSAKDGAAKVAIASKGGPSWANQLYQEGIPMTAGKTYELRFDASSTMDRPITVEFTNTSAGSESFVLTGETKTFAKTFTVATSSPLKLNFLLGNVVFGDASTPDGPHAIALSRISVKEVDSPAPEGHELRNGTFDSGLEHWGFYKKDNESDAAFGVEEGRLKIDWPHYDGYEIWATQVYQENLKLEAGRTYTLSLKLKSSIDKEVWVSVENGTDYNIQYLPARAVALTAGEERTVSFEFTMGPQTVHNGKLVLQMGGNHAVSHSILLDDVTLTG